jgi:flagellar basal body-associated protein FliL
VRFSILIRIVVVVCIVVVVVVVIVVVVIIVVVLKKADEKFGEFSFQNWKKILDKIEDFRARG